MTARLAAVCTLAFLAVASASAGSNKPTLAQLEREVMCPTCHTLLELSHAPIAERMRAFIRRRIAAGDSDSEIKRRLVAEFGEGVLAAPPARGFGLVAWLVPIGGFAATGALIAVALRSWKRAHVDESAASEELLDDDRIDAALLVRLDRELAELDR